MDVSVATAGRTEYLYRVLGLDVEDTEGPAIMAFVAATPHPAHRWGIRAALAWPLWPILQQCVPQGGSSNAHAGSRTRVTSMGGLYDAATLRAPVHFGFWTGGAPQKRSNAKSALQMRFEWLVSLGACYEGRQGCVPGCKVGRPCGNM